MRVATVTTMSCPRCGVPVQGDYKYCPECACRLRPGSAAAGAPATGSPRGTLVLALIATGLLGAGIFVGSRVLGDTPPVKPPIPTTREFLTVDDIQEHLVSVPEGVALWQPETVWEAPPDDEADDTMLRLLPRGALAAFASDAARTPGRLSRWSGLLKLFYARTRDVMREKLRHVPIRTRPFLMTRHEITRGQWAEFLRAVERDPKLLLRDPWVEGYWRPKERYEWAVNYRTDWWGAVVERMRRRFVLAYTPPQEPDNPDEREESPPDPDGDLVDPDGNPVDPDAGPDPDAVVDPTNIEIDFPVWPTPDFVKAEDFGAMSNADAVKLLYPADWVRMDESGALYWVLEAGTEDLPVTDISWWDAQLFVVWARQRLGIGSLRIPNYAEWVRAYHGNHPKKPADDFDPIGDAGWPWPWGDDIDAHGCNNEGHSWNTPTPEIRSVRRRYGWHDGTTVDGALSMAGNAAEWTRGWVASAREGGSDYYVLKDWAEESKASHASACGGSYLDGLDDCSVDGRVLLRKTERRIEVGFRLVFDATPGMSGGR